MLKLDLRCCALLALVCATAIGCGSSDSSGGAPGGGGGSAPVDDAGGSGGSAGDEGGAADGAVDADADGGGDAEVDAIDAEAGNDGGGGGGFLCTGMTGSCLFTGNGYCYENGQTTSATCGGTWADTDCRSRSDFDPPFGCKSADCSLVTWYPSTAAGQESTYSTVCTTLGGTLVTK